MSWLFSRALVAEYSAGTCSGGEPFAPSNSTPTPQAFLWRDKTTAAWRRFPSGMTCEPLTADRGEELLTSFRAAFRAKTSAPQERAPESTASEAGCGRKWHGSLARYDRGSQSWKTPQCLLFEGSAECLETWPKWGTTRDGVAYRQQTPSLLLEIRQRITAASESGSRLPTPTASDWKGPNYSQSGSASSRGLATTAGGKLNPQWVEWLMGWPIGWTDSNVLETDKFQQWQNLHGDC